MVSGKATRGNEYFIQGSVLAMAQLAQRVDWKAKPQLTQAFYQQLFHNGKLPWRFEQTRCLSTGDSVTEVMAEKIR